jgi:hypothetical protein
MEVGLGPNEGGSAPPPKKNIVYDLMYSRT